MARKVGVLAIQNGAHCGAVFLSIFEKNYTMNQQPYPLLIQGLSSDQQGTNSTLLPAAPLTNGGWSNKIQTGRGNLVLIDFIPTNVDLSTNPISPAGIFSYQVGGQAIVQNMESRNFQVTSTPRSNEILQLNQPGGQSVKLVLDTVGGTVGMVVHHYFENKFSVAAIINARRSAALKQRIVEQRATLGTGVKLASGKVENIPVGIGNVVAIEFFMNTAIVASKDWSAVLFSCIVDGSTIIDQACSAFFIQQVGRPGLIFPILIRPGSTYQITADTSELAAGDQVIFTTRLYFDDDVNGNKKYIDVC